MTTWLSNLIQSKVVNLSVKINSPMSILTSKAVDGYIFDVRLKVNSYLNIGKGRLDDERQKSKTLVKYKNQ